MINDNDNDNNDNDNNNNDNNINNNNNIISPSRITITECNKRNPSIH